MRKTLKRILKVILGDVLGFQCNHVFAGTNPKTGFSNIYRCDRPFGHRGGHYGDPIV